MELDKRIEKLSDILTCATVEEARQFIGQKGYFAYEIAKFNNLEEREYDVLACIDDDDFPFNAQRSCNHWRYFIPECRLKPEEKKYRPYTLDEFLDMFPIGQPITFRNKEYKFKKVLIFNGYETLSSGNAVINMGTTIYTPQELFDVFELQKSNEEEWQPFGMEE